MPLLNRIIRQFCSHVPAVRKVRRLNKVEKSFDFPSPSGVFLLLRCVLCHFYFQALLLVFFFLRLPPSPNPLPLFHELPVSFSPLFSSSEIFRSTQGPYTDVHITLNNRQALHHNSSHKVQAFKDVTRSITSEVLKHVLEICAFLSFKGPLTMWDFGGSVSGSGI